MDNGSAFDDEALKRSAARLGIRIIHATPYRAEGKGKIERFQCATSHLVVSPAQPEGLEGRFLGLMAYP